MRFVYDDGGHRIYGGCATGDCAIRAMSIVTGKPYDEIKQLVLYYAQFEKGKSNRSDGHSYTRLITVRKVMNRLGWQFVDIRKKPLAFSAENWDDDNDYLIWVPWHYTAVIHGVIHDMFDPSARETEIVKGYWYKKE